MGDMPLNGREPEWWEPPSVERGRRQELERDTAVLAGVLTGDVAPDPGGRPVELVHPLGMT